MTITNILVEKFMTVCPGQVRSVITNLIHRKNQLISKSSIKKTKDRADTWQFNILKWNTFNRIFFFFSYVDWCTLVKYKHQYNTLILFLFLALLQMLDRKRSLALFWIHHSYHCIRLCKLYTHYAVWILMKTYFIAWNCNPRLFYNGDHLHKYTKVNLLY